MVLVPVLVVLVLMCVGGERISLFCFFYIHKIKVLLAHKHDMTGCSPGIEVTFRKGC